MPSIYPQQFALMFTDNGINITGYTLGSGFSSGSAGKGPMMLAIINVPAGETGPVSGDYTYNSGESRVPFNYDGAVYESIDLSINLNTQDYYEIANSVVFKVIKTSDTYTCSANGLLGNGKNFGLSYTGAITVLTNKP